MAKFYGAIGYAVTKDTTPGVWGEQITERMYFGDLIRNTRKLQSADQLNDDINVYSMKYVEFMGAKWKISNVEVQYPRLILTIGGVYNEQKTTSAP